jgi:hypothetical protein
MEMTSINKGRQLHYHIIHILFQNKEMLFFYQQKSILLKSKWLCLISIEGKNLVDMKLIEQILDNFQEASFVKDLKNTFITKMTTTFVT